MDQGSESDAGQGFGSFVWVNYTQAERTGKKKYFPVPEDFMFELTKEEMEIWMSQFATSKERKSLRKAPFAFTEHGVLMLSSVPNSDRAIQMNIQIMRIFAKMREIFTTNKDILLKLEQLDRKVMKNDEDIRLIFKYLKVLLHQPEKPRKPIGYKISKK